MLSERLLSVQSMTDNYLLMGGRLGTEEEPMEMILSFRRAGDS